MGDDMAGPLNGIRILDVTSVLMGPFSTQILGDLGADVFKIEALKGDDSRFVGDARNRGMSAGFLNTNRNKKSLAIDLKSAAGRAVILRLAASCDAFISNIRPKALDRLKLDYQSLSAANPSLVYVNLVGYGRGGRYANKPAYDDLIQAVSGLAMLNQRATGGMPRYVPLALVDRIVGTAAVNAILAALLHRSRTGEGQAVEVPMFETMCQFVLGDHLQGAAFIPPLNPPGYARLLSPDRRPFATADGFIAILPYNDMQWTRYFAAIGAPELAQDPRFADISSRVANINALYSLVGAVMLRKASAEWLEILEAADIPAMPLNTIDTLMSDPHLQDVGFFQTMSHPSEGEIRTMAVPTGWSVSKPSSIEPAPRLGQNSEELLTRAGCTTTEIAELVSSGIVRIS